MILKIRFDLRRSSGEISFIYVCVCALVWSNRIPGHLLL